MNMKIYFEQEIYRIPELPSTFEQLQEVVSSKFKDSLPSSWAIYASDNEGNQSLISNNIEYLNLLKVDPQSSPQTIKIHIQAVKILQDAPDNIAEEQVQEIKAPLEAQPMEIDAESMRNILINEPSISDFSSKHDFEKRSMKKAKHIKKIGKIKRSEKRAFLLEKLQRIEYWLTPEQKEELQRKKDKYEISKISQDLPLGHHRHRHGHGHWRHHEDDHYHGHRGHHHHHGHHRGYHGRRHHERGTSTSSPSSSSSSSRSSSYDRHHRHHGGKRFHKGHHHKFAEKLQKFMFIARPAMGETQEIPKQGESLERQFENICIDSQQGKTAQKHNVKCNGCGAEAITGIRYKCSECPEFNFCEVCEAVENHPHVFLKLKTPEAEAMNRIFIADNLWKKAKKEKPHRIFKAFKTFKKMAKAQRKGDMKKFKKCHDKLFGKFAEEAKRLLSGACQWRPDNRKQIEEEWLRLVKSKQAVNMDVAAQEEQDHIERYVDEQLSRLTISD